MSPRIGHTVPWSDEQRVIRVRLEPSASWAEGQRYVDADTGEEVRLIVKDPEAKLTEVMLLLNPGDRIPNVTLFLPGPDGKPYIPEGELSAAVEEVTFEKA